LGPQRETAPTPTEIDGTGVLRPDPATPRALSPAALEQTNSSMPHSTLSNKATDRRQVHVKVVKYKAL
jgi:hypothetical protein